PIDIREESTRSRAWGRASRPPPWFRRRVGLRIILFWACGLALVATGCGGNSGPAAAGGSESRERAALQDIAELYRVYTAANNKPPAKLADLRPLYKVGPSGVDALASGAVVVRYGATMA